MMPDHVCVQTKTEQPRLNLDKDRVGEAIRFKHLCGSPCSVGLSDNWEVGLGVLIRVGIIDDAFTRFAEVWHCTSS